MFLALACPVACGGPETTTPPEATDRSSLVAAAEEPGRVRPAVHAGSWYPADPDELRREIDRRLATSPEPSEATPIVALVGPHAGLIYSGRVAAAPYRALKAQDVRRVFLLGPSHHVPFRGIALPAPDLGAYATPLGDLAIDRQAVEALRAHRGFDGPAAAHDAEHSLEMQAIFLAAVHPDVRLVPLVVGDLGHAGAVRELAGRLRPLLLPGDVVVVSSDFTHYGPSYGYLPFGRVGEDVPRQLDAMLDDALAAVITVDLPAFERHLRETRDTICGREPIRLLLALLPGETSAVRAATDTSGRITGDFTNSVSYAGVVFRRAGGWPAVAQPSLEELHVPGPRVLDPAGQHTALGLARKTLEVYLRNDRNLEDDELGVPSSGPLREVYGTFVTLKKNGRLRGCIGHILPVQPLWRDIRDNAIAAAVQDPRFPAVVARELREIEIEISVLTRPVTAELETIEIGRHGVVLEAGGRRAVFLPQVAPEQGWDRPALLSHLSLKAGLDAHAWLRPSVRFEVFEAQVFAESSTAG